MARRAEGWRLTLDERSGIYGVRWRKDGHRHHVSTGERDPSAAATAAETIYAAAVSGRRHQVARAAVAGARADLATLGAEWLADAALDDETRDKYVYYVGQWSDVFRRVAGLTGPAIEDYWRAELRRVKRRTVIKRLYALNGFLRFLVARGLLEAAPAYAMPPKSATGTPKANREAVEAIPLSEREVEAMLAALPEWSERAHKGGAKWRVRDRFVAAWETALRPATLEGLRAPGDYQAGRATLRIRDEIDKARFGREVPLSGRARDVLDRCAPEIGPIFSKVDSHTAALYLRRAAEAAGIDDERARRVKAYDLRHARLTLLAERSPNLVGVAFLAGHKALTTTNKYVHAHRAAAEEALAAVLIGTDSGRTGKGTSRGRKRG